MFTLAQPAYHLYNPYEELAVQQELQRRRQIEAYFRRQREAEEMERRRRDYEAAVRAEYEQRRQAELERRRQAELQRRRQAQQAHGRHSMYDGGLESLFEALYGGQGRPWEDRQTNTPLNATYATAHDSSPAPAPVSTPAPESTQVEPKPTPEPKVEVEEPQVDTAPSHSAVQSILFSFASLQSEFTFPTRLDFVSGSSKLAYTPNNAPLHGYEHALTGLLTQLDAVESYGDDGVRRARKEAVKAIEKELGRLDGMKAEVWRRINEPEPEVSESVVPGTETEVDPASVPLPDEEDEDMDDTLGTAVSETSESFAANQSPVLEEPLAPADSKQSEPTTLTGNEGSTSLEQSTFTDSTPVSTPPILDTGLTVYDDAALVTPLPCTPTVETPVRSPASSSPSAVSDSDSNSDLELEEYVDVETMSTYDHKDTSLGEVENNGDLELMRDWDLDF
ncbi:BAG domain protein [Rhizoctonia solani 123E]|uniref:BAG domain protein n=1 Tax=Rhizoctonia solani 123E TaxID=1423351 RepID=A0A074RVZ0_9AGAM|nr:BAG domain protein [Rhizoctonia solani 123E]